MNQIPGNSVIREFEYRISEYFDSNYALAVCNATMGILGVFYALGLSNSEIITTPLTWAGVYSGPIMLNCKIKFCDVEPESLTIDPHLIEALITPDTKAVFSADFLGYPAQLDKIREICLKHNLLLIHDAASSFGSRYKGFYSGHFADVTILSFGEKKPFSTASGGCLLTDNGSIYKKLIKTLTHPERQSLETNGCNSLSLNTKINLLAAKYGLESFDDQINEIHKRREIIISLLNQIGVSFEADYGEPNYFRILVSPENRFKFGNIISFNNLPFGCLVFNEPEFLKYDSTKYLCPISEKAIQEIKTIEFSELQLAPF
jgi:dTDP-4-amino-4,6-dideoxygalactose transaminase